jgi:hypothetical protein
MQQLIPILFFLAKKDSRSLVGVAFILIHKMEVASPLSFVPNNTGTKRQFPCTQSFVDARNAFDSPDEFLQQKSFKRRRFNMDVSMDGDSENSVNHTTFPMHHLHPKSMFASDNGEISWFDVIF